jgi:hypothetical protein
MNYQYDALNRLTEVDQPWGGSGRNCAYGYDNVDQLTSSTASGNPRTVTMPTAISWA